MKTKSKRRILTLLLAMVMVLSLFPTSAFARGVEAELAPALPAASAAAAPALDAGLKSDGALADDDATASEGDQALPPAEADPASPEDEDAAEPSDKAARLRDNYGKTY